MIYIWPGSGGVSIINEYKQSTTEAVPPLTNTTLPIFHPRTHQMGDNLNM